MCCSVMCKGESADISPEVGAFPGPWYGWYPHPLGLSLAPQPLAHVSPAEQSRPEPSNGSRVRAARATLHILVAMPQIQK